MNALLCHLLPPLLLAAATAGAAAQPLPQHLRDTGLYAAGSSRDLRPGVLAFTPQYPLWSDGADKRRWMALPAGRAIDASRPDAWLFPPGTRLWKEFSVAGRPVETRYIERRADGRWQFATYLWNDDASDAVLAPEAGIAALPVAGAPGGRYAVPARNDCLACHESAPVPVLGVSALQLSPDRDPLAPHAQAPRGDEADLRTLAAAGRLRGLAPSLLAVAPRIAAATPTERAALGYLHANCGHCHNRSSNAVPLALTLAQTVAQAVTQTAGASDAVKASVVGAPSRFRLPGHGSDARIVVPGAAAASMLALRMRSRQPQTQMPPLGTDVPDAEGLALVERWIDFELSRPTSNLPQEPRP